MDRINTELARALQRRARLALRIARAKARYGLGAADPAREREMLARVLRDAPAGLPRSELARIFRAVFTASRELVLRNRKRAS